MTQASTATARSTVWEVFRVFLKLGTTSFGGPVAHLGYFRTEFVERRKWMGDREYADLVALSQFLPGPASSQVGFGVGLLRAGGWGAVAAFVGFTLPSAVLMVAFAYGAAWISGPIGDGLLTGLKIVAVAIVAQAVWGMTRTLTPDRPRAGIAVVALATAMLLVGSVGQIVAILIGAIGGLIFCRMAVEEQRPDMLHFPVRRAVGITSLAVFFLLLVGGPALASATGIGGVALFDAVYRAGALVFGGGHVVLPLLQAGVVDPGWVTNAQFLAGYGAAQAVPGPLFTFSGYLGAISDTGPGGIWGALIALIAVFLPGFLLLLGVLPFWNTFRRRAWAQAVMRGANAAVVGILAAALYSPVFTTAITGPGPFTLAVICFVLLISWKLPPWVVVLVGAAGGILMGLL
ncbi:MAG: chromate efflux transporter [Tessaracoccus sp.]|uniref:chromate efflux transporter n=1 Tax=Tessaracoccus sp. TaxID=1971211 RepID=UPI001ED63CCA|nr:chromate efflux transporter [Tessaracoccus sp.]MBK7819801.1 chromate efflux transporter [Tessaracoccus sp.]